MNCIIVDDEPLAREAIALLMKTIPELVLVGSFGGTLAAMQSFEEETVDLVFLDIQMPGVNGLDFARSIPEKTLVIFTTAYAEYALDSYEVDAVDYLIKPVKKDRFIKAVNKALQHQKLIEAEDKPTKIESTTSDYFFIRSDRKVFKVMLKDILLIEGLKDYVIIHTTDQKIITAMNIKTIYDKLPLSDFARVSKSYIINIHNIGSFDNNTVYIQSFEIPIGNAFRNYFFDEVVSRRLLSK